MNNVAVKKEAAKSEAWLSVITAAGTMATAYVSHIEGGAAWVSLSVCLLLAGVYAFFRTPLASRDGRPGVKTKAFWGAVIVVIGSHKQPA